MNEDSAVAAFARAVQRPESEFDLGTAALAIALMEYPTLDVQGYLDNVVVGLERMEKMLKSGRAKASTPSRRDAQKRNRTQALKSTR